MGRSVKKSKSLKALAIEVADNEARRAIEDYAKWAGKRRGHCAWDSNQHKWEGVEERWAVSSAQAAVAYLKARGDAFPDWRMCWDEAEPHIVWFEDKRRAS